MDQNVYLNPAAWLASQQAALKKPAPVNGGDASWVGINPVNLSAPANNMPPIASLPSSAVDPMAPSKEVRIDPATGMPIFTQGDFAKFVKLPKFITDNEGSLTMSSSDYNYALLNKDRSNLDAIYQQYLAPYAGFFGQQFNEENPAPKTFADYLAQRPVQYEDSTARGGPTTVDEWLAGNTAMGWNPDSAYAHTLKYQMNPGTPNSFGSSEYMYEFGPNGELQNLREKTGKRQGTWNAYQNVDGQFVPTGAKNEGYWNTNGRGMRDLASVAAAMAAAYFGGTALQAAQTAGAGGAAAGAGAGAAEAGAGALGAAEAGAGAGALASAGTPIALTGAEGITMSSLPALGETGFLGAAGQFLKANSELVGPAVGAIAGLTSGSGPSAGTAAAQAGSSSVADQQMALAREQWEWQKQQDQRLSPIYEQLLKDSLTDAQKQRERGDSMWEQYNSLYRPIEQRAATDAMNFDNPAEVARREGMAQATVQRGFDDAEAQRRRDLARSGVSASSGRGTSSTLANTRALATSQAVNTERTNTQATGMSLRDNAIRVGRGIDSAGLSRDVAGIQGQNSAQGVMQNQTNQRNSALAPALSAFSGSNASYGTAAGIANNEWGQNYQRRSDQAGLWGVLAGGAARYFSDEKLKEKKRPMDAEWLAGQVKKMRVDKWKYKDGVADSGEHIGPYAKDFADVFGGDGKTIDAISAVGVALGASKGNALAIERVEKKLDKLLAA